MNPDIIAKYLWIALICIVIVIAVVVVFPPGEVRSECSGFQYFFFRSQKMTGNEYSLELLDGVRDVMITGLLVDGSDVGVGQQAVKAGDTFIIKSVKDPTTLKPEEVFRYKVTVLYDITDGIPNNRDVATCTGRVQ